MFLSRFLDTKNIDSNLSFLDAPKLFTPAAKRAPANIVDLKLKNSNLKLEVEPRAGFDPATITLPR